MEPRRQSLLSLSYLLDEVLAKLGGRNLVLVDACRDLPRDPSRGSKGVQGKVIVLPEETAVLFSCRAGQQSYESKELKHGVFTHCVLEGLRGAGASDGQVDWSGVVTHVNRRMAHADIRKHIPSGRMQEPIPAGGVPLTILGTLQSDSFAGKRAGEARSDNGLQMKLIWCPPGTFMMGSPPTEKMRHEDEDRVEVTLTKGFWLGQTEVTQGQWKQLMGTEPWKRDGFVQEGADYPVTNVSWQSADEFCGRLTKQDRTAGDLGVSVANRSTMGICVPCWNK